jgi:outer membrane usher protein
MPKKEQQRFNGRISPLIIAMLSALYGTSATASMDATEAENNAHSVEFDASFLNMADPGSMDLSRFTRGSAAMPGVYSTAIWLNDTFISRQELEMVADANGATHPCLNAAILKDIPLKEEALPADFFKTASEKGCVDLQSLLPDIKVEFDSNEQRLNLQIPQIYLHNAARGSVSPNLWDRGIPALMLGYNFNAWENRSRGTRFRSFYTGINGGLNIGGWYLRHNGSWNWDEQNGHGYNSINTYVQRDIPQIRSRALFGEANTKGQVFDTLPFRGVQLASDERMLPESRRGYAPDIRGIARTNARVIVRQGEQTLYETTVPPGEFLINDLYPTGYGGDLEVTVQEADGSEERFRVPYSAVAQLLRPGTTYYSVTAGKLRDESLRQTPELYEGTLQYGLNNLLTLYGGAQFNQNYHALQLGSALGLPVGAFSFDVTQARTKLGNGDTSSGQSYRLSYSKTVNETNSNLALAAYRFSTRGYMDFLNAMQTRDIVARGEPADTLWRAKNRFTLTAGQGLPAGWGHLYASGSLQNYWNKEGHDKQFQLGYSNQYKQLSWSLSASRTYSSYGEARNNYMLSFSLPLGSNSNVHAPQLRMDLSHDTDGRTAQQAAITGIAGDDNQYSYGLNLNNANQNTGASASVNGQYRSRFSNLGASYSGGKGYRSTSFSMNGTLIGHSGGVTLSPYTSDTFALVEAPGAAGARVSGYPGIYIDALGYAAVPHLDPYRLNEISLDPKGTSNQVELDTTSQKVAPWSGAVVKLKYKTNRGTPILINSSYQGQPLPFGASVSDDQGNNVGAVGQGGQVYARVNKEQGSLRVSWGQGSHEQCQLRYRLLPGSADKKSDAMQTFTMTCQ